MEAASTYLSHWYPPEPTHAHTHAPKHASLPWSKGCLAFTTSRTELLYFMKKKNASLEAHMLSFIALFPDYHLPFSMLLNHVILKVGT